MKQEDKNLLLKDLCARLPYRVKVSLQYGNKQLIGVLDAVYPTEERVIIDKLSDAITPIDVRCGGFKLNESNIMPYLRPMASMTKEEREEIEILLFSEWFDPDSCKVDGEGYIEILANYDVSGIEPGFCSDYVDWLNAHHFDFRNLIDRGLALDCTDLNVY